MIVAILAGFEEVLGIERDPQYVELGRKRIAWWTGSTVPVSAPLGEEQPMAPVLPMPGQLNLF